MRQKLRRGTLFGGAVAELKSQQRRKIKGAMVINKSRVAAIIAVMALGACSQDAVMSDSAAPPTPGVFQPTQVTPGASTGTAVGARVQQMRADFVRTMGTLNQQSTQLQGIRRQATQDAQGYYALVAGINARLQVGTTPGNPELVNAWNQAQGQLEKLNSDLSQMNSLGTAVSDTSSQAAFLLESVRATYGISGAVDEDHRQLKILENEVNQSIVLVDRLLSELSTDIARQSAYVSAERNNLVTLNLAVKNGRLLGPSLQNRTYQQGNAAPAMVPSAAPASRVTAPPQRFSDVPTGQPNITINQNRRPLLVVKFDHPRVQYEQALYDAVSEALRRKPDAAFELVAVAPGNGSVADVALSQSASKQQAQTVLRSLTSMGVDPGRVGLSSAVNVAANTTEVQLYVR
jgi:hypothetical protein